MISLAVDPVFINDLEDDFMMNEELDLYEFINNDPVKAFYLGYNIDKWFKDLEKNQRYLYSKQIRHNKDDLEKYETQIKYWVEKFHTTEQVPIIELSEYVLNNMFWDEKTEELDRVKLAFFFGTLLYNSQQDNNPKSNDT